MTLRLHVLGAAHTVTGSCHLFETDRGRFLVDCGMFQGSKTVKELNYRDFPFSPRGIDRVLLTHAHIDHSGLLPKLVEAGFRGEILATAGTADLCSYMLPDAGHIQETEVEHLNRRNKARGRREVQPIYTLEDARRTLGRFRAVDYERWVPVIDGVRARFWNAGHLLGSASIELEFETGGANGGRLRVLCSGDLGPDAKLLQEDPEAPAGFDHVLCESTYGDRDRPATTPEERRRRLAAEVRDAAAAGGALIIPAFAVERTQELIVDLVDLMDRGLVPDAPIFINSPLAIRVTEVFLEHAGDLDKEVDVARLMRSPRLKFTETVEQSKAIARVEGFHVILAASGMCDAGRIRHHLKQWLWNRRATVLMVGYQAAGTLGRILVDGARTVRIQGEEIAVAARIRRMDEYSGHADAGELARWISERLPIRHGLFLVHGETEAMEALARRVAAEHPDGPPIVAPQLDDVFDLTAPLPAAMGLEPPRLTPEAVTRPDWHNERSRLILDIDEAFEQGRDDAARRRLAERLRAALVEARDG